MHSRRRSAIALRHVAFEDLGLLAAILDSAGWDVSYCSAPTEDLSYPIFAEADLLIVLGGPIGAYEIETYPFLAKEIDLLERRLAKDLPILGICLGGQLVAKALGTRVFTGDAKEIGWGRVELTKEGEASCLGPLAEPGASVLHWHGDTFEIPIGAVRLASNANYPNQAFAYGRRTLALQFHLEADPARLEEWYVGHAAELSAVGISVAGLRSTTASLAPRLRPQAEAVFSSWLRQIGEE